MNTADRTGSEGGRLITSATGAVTDVQFGILEVLEDGTIFSVLNNAFYGKGDSLTSRVWKRGDRIAGLTSAVTVSAGAVHGLTQV
jgi:hypothetical protein